VTARTGWRTALAAAGLVSAQAACGGDAPSGGPPPSLAALTFDTLFEVGAGGGANGVTFGGIWDVEASPDGHFAVLDLEAPAVHVFDDDGSLVGSVTESGLDEGALDRPSGLAWASDDELLVWDPGSSWISRFDVSSTVEFVDRFRAFAFGETGFCSVGGRTYLSYWQDGQVVHEIAAEGPAHSFGPAPRVVGIDSLGIELQEIATEELTPSGLLCTPEGVLDVSFVQSAIRFHDLDGNPLWERELEDFTPVVAYSPDGMGLGRMFDPDDGSHLLRSVTHWGEETALVQHELRTREIPEAGEIEVFESRLVRLADGVELERTRALPLILAAQGSRIYVVRSDPAPRVLVIDVSGGV
jgi:hypothetical protein